MRKKRNLPKIQILFAILLICLAGISISYSGFYDEKSVYSIVDTGTITFSQENYSGTDVWSVHPLTPETPCPEGEIIIWHGFTSDRLTQESIEIEWPGCEVSLIASSWASSGSEEGVDMVWDNLLPNIDFNASVIVNYTGSVPAKVEMSDLIWDLTGNNTDLTPYATLNIYDYTLVDNQWVKGDEIPEIPVQMHNNEYIGIEITVYLTEEDVNGIEIDGRCSFDISADQWNNYLE